MINKKYLSIGEVGLLLGVSVSTLRRWESEEKLIPAYRTPGNHRRYELSVVLNLVYGSETAPPRRSVCYARVSGHDQKKDLERQKKRLAKYCLDKKLTY